jgi:hypothetical protein
LEANESGSTNTTLPPELKSSASCCAVEKDDYPADLVSLFKSASSSYSSASEAVEESEAAAEASRASADSYGECPLCGDLFPVVSLQVRL